MDRDAIPIPPHGAHAPIDTSGAHQAPQIRAHARAVRALAHQHVAAARAWRAEVERQVAQLRADALRLHRTEREAGPVDEPMHLPAASQPMPRDH